MSSKVQLGGHTAERRDGESVLDALIRSGSDAAFSCKKGSCHVCMLRAVQGTPDAESQADLRDSLRERGYFLPCQMRSPGDLVVDRPRSEDLSTLALVAAKDRLAPDVLRLRLELGPSFSWRPGQFVNLRRPDGIIRSYSSASCAEQDYFLDLHIRLDPKGVMSPWLFNELDIGADIEIQGPYGACHYHTGEPNRPLLLIAGGTGLGPLYAILRDALHKGHRGPIYLYHGARSRAGLYLHNELQALASGQPNLRYSGCLSEEQSPDLPHGLVSDLALRQHEKLADWRIFLCGPPALVHAARWGAIRRGASRSLIHADPFTTSAPYMPKDAETVASIAPDPELWAALEEGSGLTAILTDFYDRVFEDARLRPFFHNVTKRRVIEKQYEFLHELFTGNDVYFGLRPFNAHHWIVISDDLFDYRESLFEDCMRRYGLAPHLMARWMAIHERFRADIVKAAPRGIVEDGVERYLERFDSVPIAGGSLCDGCGAEIADGTIVRYHMRTGLIYCTACQPTFT
jgi:NAD(P)H-flavin reductase/ferredoxin/truncated hemoglobin YjbI